MALGTVNYKMNPMIFSGLRLMSGQIIAINLSPFTRNFSFNNFSSEEEEAGGEEESWGE